MCYPDIKMDMPMFKNFIFVSLDATSPQRLSCYGHNRITTPQIEQALAEGGAAFKNAFSQAPFTVMSHSSMLSSLYLISHRVVDWTTKLNAELTLASVFQKNGFATAGFTNHPCLSKKFGYHTGFDTFLTKGTNGRINIAKDSAFLFPLLREVFKRGPAKMLGLAQQRFSMEVSCAYGLSWIKTKRQKPFFLFLHLFSAHPCYNAPAPFRGLFLKDVPDNFKDIRLASKQREYGINSAGHSDQEKSEFIELLGRLHDEELAYNDNQVGALLATLKKLNIHKETLVAITSDHGNFLPIIPTRNEGIHLFDNNLRVPLIFINPHLRSNQEVECLAQTIDIFPTLLSFAGLEIPATVQGKDLKKTILDNAPCPHQYIYANYASSGAQQNRVLMTAIRSKEWKFIYEEKTGQSRLYNLTEDAKEMNNLSAKLPQKIAAFLTEYRQWKEKTLRHKLDAKESSLSKSESGQLRALGYID